MQKLLLEMQKYARTDWMIVVVFLCMQFLRNVIPRYIERKEGYFEDKNAGGNGRRRRIE